MSSKSFEFQIAEDVEVPAMIKRARAEARATGINIEGDEAGGRFNGTAEGTYAVDGRTLHVEVTDKPAFVPWRLVESALRKVFG